MSYAALVAIAADRYTPAVRQLTFRGLSLAGVTLRMQVRLVADAPGSPLIDLQVVENAQAEGLKLVSTSVVDGLPTSVVQIRINKSTMRGLPYAGELGDGTRLVYDLIGTLGGDERVLMRGDFLIQAGVTGADAAPANRPFGAGVAGGVAGMRTGAILTFGETKVEIAIDNAALLAPMVASASAASDAAATSRDAAALSANKSDLSASTALAAVGGVLYPTTAAGLAAVAANAYFGVIGDNAATFAIIYQKVNGAAVERLRYASRAAYEGAGGAALIGYGAMKVADKLTRLSTYATRAALAAAGNAAAEGENFYLVEGNRRGRFVYTAANLSVVVAKDTAQGIYIARAGDASGATGGFIRDWDGDWAQSIWFGDGWAGVVAAYNIVNKVTLPEGTIARTSDLHVTSSVWGLRGAGQGKTTITVPNAGIIAYADGVSITSFEAYGFDLALAGPAATQPAFALGVFNLDCAGFDIANVDIHHIGGSLLGHSANFVAIVAHGGNVVRSCIVRDCSVVPGLRMFAEFVQHDAPQSPNAMIGMAVERCSIERKNADGINILVSFSGAMTGCRTAGNRYAGGGGTAVALELAGNHVSGDHEAWFDGSFASPGGFVTVTPNIAGSATTGTRIRYRVTPGAKGRFLLASDFNLQLDAAGPISPDIVVERTSLSVNAAPGPFPEFEGFLGAGDKVAVTFPAASFWQTDTLDVTASGQEGSGGNFVSIRKTLMVSRISGNSIGIQDRDTRLEKGAVLAEAFSSTATSQTLTLSLSGYAGAPGINWHVKALRRGTGIMIGKV